MPLPLFTAGARWSQRCSRLDLHGGPAASKGVRFARDATNLEQKTMNQVKQSNKRVGRPVASLVGGLTGLAC
jgi:hypothetical protein